jgi:hypothetical protein
MMVSVRVYSDSYCRVSFYGLTVQLTKISRFQTPFGSGYMDTRRFRRLRSEMYVLQIEETLIEYTSYLVNMADPG